MVGQMHHFHCAHFLLKLCGVLCHSIQTTGPETPEERTPHRQTQTGTGRWVGPLSCAWRLRGRLVPSLASPQFASRAMGLQGSQGCRARRPARGKRGPAQGPCRRGEGGGGEVAAVPGGKGTDWRRTEEGPFLSPTGSWEDGPRTAPALGGSPLLVFVFSGSSPGK